MGKDSRLIRSGSVCDFVQLAKFADECTAVLTQAAEELADEEEEDRAARGRFQGAWARPASDAFNMPLRSQIRTYREGVRSAIETNKKVENKVDAVKAQFPLMTKTREELDALAPPAGSAVELFVTGSLLSSIDEVHRVRNAATEKMQLRKLQELIGMPEVSRDAEIIN